MSRDGFSESVVNVIETHLSNRISESRRKERVSAPPDLVGLLDLAACSTWKLPGYDGCQNL